MTARAYPIPETDRDAIRQMWTRLFEGGVREVRIPDTRKHGPNRLWGTVAGFFDDGDAFADAAAPIGPLDAKTIYITLNPVKPDLLARRANRLAQVDKGESTGDADIAAIEYLLIDIDPERDSHISATEDERQAALATRDAVRAYLTDQGWPEPAAVGSSGNGGSLIYRVALENTEARKELLERVLKALGALFTTRAVKIDQTTFNPSRLTKVFGTVAAKGDQTEDRRWNQATADYFDTRPVTEAQLRAVADQGAIDRDAEPEQEPSRYARKTLLDSFTVTGAERGWTLAEVLKDSGIDYTTRQASYGTVYRLDRCLSSEDHTDGACITEMNSGALSYRCHHDRCSGKGWHDIKHRLTIPAGSPRAGGTGTKEPASAKAGAIRSAVLVTAAEIEPMDIEWLWRQWLPKRMLTILGGFPGDGKSTLLSLIIARLTRGGTFPDGSIAPVTNCLMLAAEDDPQYAIVPRLKVHGADLNRVHLLRGSRRDDGTVGWVNLQRDIDLMRAAIRDHDIGLVTVDPLSSYMPKADRNSEGDVRDALMPLQQLMDETGVAVIGIMHVGKGDAHRKTFQLLLGSTAFTALARTVWMVHDLPGDHQPEADPETGKRKALGIVKSNYAIPPAALAFSRPLDGPIRFHGVSPVSIDEAFAGGTKVTKTEITEDWLRDFLKAGPQLARVVIAASKQAGISYQTLQRVSRESGIVTKTKDPGTNGQWRWQLAENEDVHQDPVQSYKQGDEHLSFSYTNKDVQPGKMNIFPESSEDVHDPVNEHLPNGAGTGDKDVQNSLYRKMNIFPPEPGANGPITERIRQMPTGQVTDAERAALNGAGPGPDEATRRYLERRQRELAATEDGGGWV